MFIVLASISSFAMAADFLLVGNGSCGQWVETRKNSLSNQTEAWLAGYLTCLVSGTGYDVLVSRDAASMYLWMDKYCAENPLNQVALGANDLFSELKYKPKN
ncbi:MAG: hypothetical protein ACI9T7_001899 [Oleiphilaceae bacterium]